MMSMMCRPSIYTNELINLNLDLYQIHFQKVPMIYQMKIFTLFKLCVQFLLKPRYVSKMKEKKPYIYSLFNGSFVAEKKQQGICRSESCRHQLIVKQMENK